MPLTKRHWLVGALALIVLAGAIWYLWPRRDRSVVVDLVDAFRGAEKRTNVGSVAAAFSMDPQTIGGVTRPAIYMHPHSRVTYRGVRIPAGGRMRAWLAIKDEAWDKGTDGVYFRIGVAANGVYTDHLKRHVDPFRVPADRGWVPVDIDLAQYASQTVDVVINTEPSVPGNAPHFMYDYAVIGAPAIVVPLPG
jgi:hypothetical protein